MRIVVLDGAALTLTVDSSPLRWTELEALGEVVVYDRTSRELLVERAADADVLVVNKFPLTSELLALLPRLKYVTVTATGYNVVDIAAASARGVLVSNVPEYGSATVAQFTFALLLELCHRVGAHDALVRTGRWSSSPDFCFVDTPQLELDGKTLGVVGLGRIGGRVAGLARAFGMRVIATRRSSAPLDPGVEPAELDALFAQSDVVSLHCPLTPETAGLVNAARLARMRRSAFLLNTARGPLLVEQDLAFALREGWIAGAAVDVASVEPIAADNPLLSAPNCIITPHIAWAAREARERLLRETLHNVAAFVRGAPRNLVNPPTAE